MSQKKQNVVFALGVCFVLGLGYVGPASADRIDLTEQEMDLVDAGYLRVSASAFALAIGRNALAVSGVSTDVSSGRNSRRYAYSLGRASAYALAAGDVARTDIGSVYDTNEEIVRSRLRVVSRSRGDAAQLARRFGIELPSGMSFSQVQVSRLEFTIVTRAPGKKSSRR